MNLKEKISSIIASPASDTEKLALARKAFAEHNQDQPSLPAKGDQFLRLRQYPLDRSQARSEAIPVYTVLSRNDLVRMLAAHDAKHARNPEASGITTSSWHGTVAPAHESAPLDGRLQLSSHLRLA